MSDEKDRIHKIRNQSIPLGKKTRNPKLEIRTKFEGMNKGKCSKRLVDFEFLPELLRALDTWGFENRFGFRASTFEFSA